MSLCSHCGQSLPEESRFCIRCGRVVWPGAGSTPGSREAEAMNMTALYVMVLCLVLAALFPPWETPPGQPPEFLGFHFVLNPPRLKGNGTGVISRALMTVEFVTIAVAGFYASWLLRSRPK